MVCYFWCQILSFFNLLNLVFENPFGIRCKRIGGQCCEARRKNHIHMSEVFELKIFGLFLEIVSLLPVKEMETLPAIT
jgi:hypothetical protein